MPNTRKKVIKTVYKDEDDSDNEGHDFSDSGSEAVITDTESSEEEGYQQSSDDDFQSESFAAKRQSSTSKVRRKPKSCKNKINKQCFDNERNLGDTPVFSVKNLTDADKLLPSILNLSESDSSDDESPKTVSKSNTQPAFAVTQVNEHDSDTDTFEYKDVWSENIQDNSEEIAKKTFKELELQNTKIEETKISIQNYSIKNMESTNSDVKDLLALGEEETMEPEAKTRRKIVKEDSDSEMEDWEEVKDVKGIPQQGLQLIVGIPDGVSRKKKKLDIEMMMKRKMNRVKKEHQVFIHKVHVLCWLGHGNYVSKVLNDQEILAAALSLVPSKECYPGERVDVKYVEQITTWYKDKITLVQDKNENKFKPKAPPLKELLLKQIKSKVFSTKKYIAFVFISMLRSLGLQCRVMFNFVTLPIRPPSSELCSLSTKSKGVKPTKNETEGQEKKTPQKKTNRTKKKNIPQVDGNYESSCESDNIMQVDGNDDNMIIQTRRQKNIAANNAKKHLNNHTNIEEGVSPPKRAKRNINKIPQQEKKEGDIIKDNQSTSKQKDIKKGTQSPKTLHKSLSLKTQTNEKEIKNENLSQCTVKLNKQPSPRKTRSKDEKNAAESQVPKPKTVRNISNMPKIVIKGDNDVSSKYFKDTHENDFNEEKKQPQRKRPQTSEPKKIENTDSMQNKTKRARSAHMKESKSEYFTSKEPIKRTRATRQDVSSDKKRVTHKDLAMNKTKNNDVTADLVKIIKGRVKAAKEEEKRAIIKGKIKSDSDEDSDHLPVESKRRKKSESDDDFKPKKLSPKPISNVKKIDRQVLSTEDDLPLHKVDVWCEVFIEELEEWVAVDIIKGKVHCVNEIYNRATHPVNYVVGWDNNNYLKDLTRKYVPHWNTITRKQRVEPSWWNGAIKAWLGPKTAKDKEEDERLDRMQLEAPLPKSIAEYKNHPLYALKRHLLKFEAIYPPDAATLGFVRGEAVYARDCVYVCRSRDTWLKEAKVVRLGEQPYKVVKARPKWDKLSNKLITDKPLEVFGPWQVQDYEPPVAENGVVPRNPYGNVELFKDCMLPKGTVHIKLPGLNRIAKKLNIDCAPAMTGFEFNGGWSHPVYDGFVVCKEFEAVITEAWLEDQEEQERKEIEKTEARVYGNWRRLIRGLFIKERLKAKYGFEAPSTSQDKKKTGPRLVVKKK